MTYFYVVAALNPNGAFNSSQIVAVASGATIIVDNASTTGVTIIGAWVVSTSQPGYYGPNYLQDEDAGSVGGKKVIFTPNLPATTGYQVYLNWPVGSNRATDTPVDVNCATGTTTFSINQQVNGTWRYLGTFTFNAGTGDSVVVRDDGANDYVIADAVKFVQLPSPPSAPDVLTATGGNGQVVLSWNAAIGATGYSVERSTTNGGAYVMVAQNVTRLSYTNTDLTNGIMYYFVVLGTNSGGESPNSPQIAVQPVSLAPVQMALSSSPGQLQVSWPADHLGWYLQAQTNRNGIGTNWYAWPGTANTNIIFIPISISNPTFFLRLTYP
jgi:hypothetical protein